MKIHRFVEPREAAGLPACSPQAPCNLEACASVAAWLAGTRAKSSCEPRSLVMTSIDALCALAPVKRTIASLMLMSVVCSAAAMPEYCADIDQTKTDASLAPYSVACAGRSECSSVDQLEIRPIDGAAARPLKSVCLRLAGGNDAAAVDLRVYRQPASSQVATAYPLAPLFERWLADDKLNPILRSAAKPRLPVAVIFVDDAGSRFKREIVFDLAAQWSSGSLPLNIEKVTPDRCKKFECLLTLSVPDLATWKRVAKGDPAKLNLVVSGTRLPGITPEVSLDEGKGALRYQLLRRADKPEMAEAWRAIVKRVLAGESKFSVGLADDKGVIVSSDKGGVFEVPSAGKRAFATLFAAFVLAAAVIVLAQSAKSQWLRDAYEIPDDLVPSRSRPFSLGRCQMLWWTVVVAVSWFAIGFATGDWLSINDSAVVVMGISAATAAGAVAIVPTRIASRVQAYVSAKTAAAGKASDPAFLAAKAALAGDAELRTKSLAADLLSDYGEGTGLHRLQNLLFTIAFGLYFAWVAFHDGAMPSLSSTVLALMGISGSTYVGFKLAGKVA